MAHQYFENNEDLDHDYGQFTTKVNGETMTFKTDSGVFSKKGLDYGSRVLLETVDGFSVEEGPLLDLGCGYGPIGITLAKAYPSHLVHMVDINSRALDLAGKNAEMNHVSNVSIYPSDAYTSVSEHQFSLIVTNPPVRAGKKVVNAFITGAYSHLKEKGQFVAVIQKKQGAPSAKKLMAEVFGKVETLTHSKGYWVLYSKK